MLFMTWYAHIPPTVMYVCGLFVTKIRTTSPPPLPACS